MGWANLILGAGQLLLGVDQKSKADQDAKTALAMRKPYKTPAELYKILQATEYNAQQGFDPVTLAYLTNQTDRAFTSALDTTQHLGGDPNDVAALFDQKMQSILRIGAENHSLNMENFSRYLAAEDAIAKSKDAEWQDAENKVKDRQQQAAVGKVQATQQISEGFNTIASGIGQIGMNNLYTDNKNGLDDQFNDYYGTKKKGYDRTKGTGRANYKWAKKLGMTSLDQYIQFQKGLSTFGSMID